jgi:hypothetical protein
MRHTFATFASAFTIAALMHSLPAGAEVIVEAVPEYEVDFAVEELASATEEVVAITAAVADLPGKALFVPYYEVDRSRPDGKTTLIAVRNTSVTGTVTATMSFYGADHLHPAAHTTTLRLGPREVRTFNLRDLPLTGAAARGAVGISVSGLPVETPGMLTGDYFLVDPSQSFAVGERMLVADDRDYGCTRWEMRYLQGGAFTGGTELRYFVGRPQGTGPGVGPTMLVRVVDEAGRLQGTVRVFTNRHVGTLRVSDLLRELPGASPFGALEIELAGAAGRGVITGMMSASGRFAVGLDGACLRR